LNGGEAVSAILREALDHGDEAVSLVSSIVDAIEGKHPELRTQRIAAEGAAMSGARARAQAAIKAASDE
jgi:hypothetical protein